MKSDTVSVNWRVEDPTPILEGIHPLDQNSTSWDFDVLGSSRKSNDPDSDLRHAAEYCDQRALVTITWKPDSKPETGMLVRMRDTGEWMILRDWTERPRGKGVTYVPSMTPATVYLACQSLNENGLARSFNAARR